MFIDDLKKSILQKAIQWKLVEQNPNDEPASELLKRIREEKEKLIKDGKIKKEKSLSPITDKEKVFDIPSSWEWVRVRDVCYFWNGEKMSWKKYPYLEARYLRGKDAGKIYSEWNFVEKWNRLILVDWENSWELFDLNEDWYLWSTFKIFNTYKSINADYLQKFLTFRKDEFRNNKTWAAIPHLNKDLFFNYPLPLPPLEEQKRIVAKLDELMPLLDEARPLEEEITKLEKDFPAKLRQSILQYAIQWKLVEQNSEDEPASELLKKIKEEKEKLIKEWKIPKEKELKGITPEEMEFEIPSNWQYVRMQDVASYITDYVANWSFATLKKHTKTYKTKNYAIFVRTLDLTANFLWSCSYIDEQSYNFLEKSKLYWWELILPNIGGSIWKAFIMPNLWMPMSLAPNSIMVKFYDNSMNKFFWYLIQSSYWLKFLNKTQWGTATPKFSKTDLRNMVVPLPPLEEQKRIVAKLDELMKLCNELEEQIG